MNKKRNNPNKINNINVDIDYEKLANVIEESIKKCEKIDYEKLVQVIVSESNRKCEVSDLEEKRHSITRSKLMNMLNGIFYSMLYTVSLMYLYSMWNKYTWKDMENFFTYVAVSLLLILLSIYGFLCQQESFSDRYQDTIAHFNTNIMIITMLITILTLIKF